MFHRIPYVVLGFGLGVSAFGIKRYYDNFLEEQKWIDELMEKQRETEQDMRKQFENTKTSVERFGK